MGINNFFFFLLDPETGFKTDTIHYGFIDLQRGGGDLGDSHFPVFMTF